VGFEIMEMFNFGFWLTLPIFLIFGFVPSFLGGIVTYLINKKVEESDRLIKSIKVALVLLPLFSCGICNYYWTR